MPQAVVRRKALFWVANGVLLESRTASGDAAYRCGHMAGALGGHENERCLPVSGMLGRNGVLLASRIASGEAA